MIKTRAQIEIDARGRWMHQGNEIINPDILTYFKANLERADDGYFIRNSFGEKEEHAYLDQVQNFPLYVEYCEVQAPITADNTQKNAIILHVRLDSGQSYQLDAAELYLFAEDCLAIFLKERNLYARLTSSAMAGLMENLVEQADGVFGLIASTSSAPQTMQLLESKDLSVVHG